MLGIKTYTVNEDGLSMTSDDEKKIRMLHFAGKTGVATAIASGLLSISVIESPKFFGENIGVQQVNAAVLNTEILSNVQTTNSSGTTATSGFDPNTSQNVTFTISGAGLANVSAINLNKKVAVLAIPDDLVGKVSPNGDVTVNTAVTLRLDQLPALQAVVTGTNNLLAQVTNLLDTTTNAVGLSTNTQEVVNQLQLLNNLIKTGQATFTAPLQVSADGKYLYADLNAGLGQVLSQNLTTILNGLKNAVNALSVTGRDPLTDIAAGTINATLLPVKLALSGVIDTANGALGLTGNLVSTLADAAVLGDTQISIPTTISAPNSSVSGQPGNVVAENFYGSAVNTDLIDINLLRTSNGVTPVYYNTADTTAPGAPVVDPVTGDTSKGYTVSGTTEAGATVTLKDAAGNTVGTTTADGGGQFSTTLPGTGAELKSSNGLLKIIFSIFITSFLGYWALLKNKMRKKS